MAGYQTLNVTGLLPNSTYTILVYAVRTVNGVVTHSQPTKLSITTPVLSSSGSNFKVTNGGTDMQLLGGTIYAGTFDDGMGQFDPLANSINGLPVPIGSGNYGVALNQFGIAAYNAGTPEFYIDSRTGNAYFAGTIASSAIQSTNYSGVTNGSAYSTSGTYINLNDGSITSQNFRITSGGAAYFAGSITSNATIAGVAASDLLSYAQAGQSVSTVALRMVGTTLSNATGQVSTVGANGTTFFSGNYADRGARVLINSLGIVGYNSSSTSNSDTPTFAIVSSDQTINGQTIKGGSGYFTGVIQASTFLSSNYFSSGSGFALASSAGVDSINFSYNGSITGYIASYSSGKITIQNSSQNTKIDIGSSPTSSVVVTNGTVSYGGTVGHVRNVWANTSSGTVPTANSTVTTLAGMLTDPKEGDIYLVWA